MVNVNKQYYKGYLNIQMSIGYKWVQKFENTGK